MQKASKGTECLVIYKALGALHSALHTLYSLFMSNKQSYFKKFNKEYYSTGAYEDYIGDEEGYLKHFSEEDEWIVEKILSKMKPQANWKFLDVGCGMGGTIMALRDKGYKAFGAEISPFCLEKSPMKKYIKFGDVCDLKYPNNSFDVVITCDILPYVSKKDLPKAIKELTRITKRYFFVATICKGSPNNNQKLNPDSLRKSKEVPTPNQLINLIKKQGFNLIGPAFTRGIRSRDFNNLFKKIK